MGFFSLFKIKKHNTLNGFKNSNECNALLAHIEHHNESLKVVREEFFNGEGKEYKYYFDCDKIRASGYYFYLGYDKNGKIVEERFQGKNIEYYESGNVKEIVIYKDGLPTGERYYYDNSGNLLL